MIYIIIINRFKESNMTKNDYNFDDISDVEFPEEVKLGRSDDFGREIMEIFYGARENGISELNVNQVMVVFYRKFSEKYKDHPKTNIQIMNKLFAMAAGKKFPLEKVEGKQGTYRLKEVA